MAGLMTALKYLTFLHRWGVHQPDTAEVGRAVVHFWLIALLLGFVLSMIYRVSSLYITPSLLSLIMLLLLIGATGSMHLQGLRNTFDDLARHRPGSQAERTPICGFMAVLAVVLLKLRAFDIIDELFISSLLVVPLLARWAWVLFVYGYGDRCDEQARTIANGVSLPALILSSAAAITCSTYILGERALTIVFAVSLLTLLFRSLLHRCQSIITHDNFHAVIELAEALSFAIIATF